MPEPLIATFYYFTLKIFTLTLVQISVSIIEHHNTLALLLMYLVLAFLSLILLTKEKLARKDLDSQNRALEENIED